MRNWKALALTLAVVIGGFFSSGCTAQQRHEWLMDAKEIVIDEIKEQLPKAKEYAADLIEKRLREEFRKKELEQYAVFDAQLEKLAKTDPDTGITSKKTWRDFDESKDDSIQPVEVGKLSAYILKEAAGRDDFGDMAKTTAGAAGILALLGIGSKGSQAVIKKLRGSPTPTDPSQPLPPPPGAGSPPVPGTTV